MKTSDSKEKHIDIRVSQEEKELLERAAELRGMSLNTYLLFHCLAAAQEDLATHQKLVLSDRDRDLFLQLLDNPPKPEKALVEAMRQFQAEFEPNEVGY